jgi:Spy/CpxP family protein refolding chaperone
MKKVITSFLALTIISFSVTAQEKRELSAEKMEAREQHKKGKKSHMMEKMKDLNLSDAQKAQLKSIMEEEKTKMQALKQQQNITVKEYNDRKEAIARETKAKRDAVLTAEQKNKLAQSKIERKENEKAHFEKKMDKMTTKLSLSNDQAAKLKVLHEQKQSKIAAIRENQSLNKEEKKQQIMALKNSVKDQQKAILTAEQFQKMEAMKKAKKDKGRKHTRK